MLTSIRKMGIVRCVDFDPANQNSTIILPTPGGKPTIAQLKAAIAGSGVASSYPAAFMFAASKNDLIAICRANAIAVAGLPGA